MSTSEYEINPHEVVEAYKEEAIQSYVAHHHRGRKVIAHLNREVSAMAAKMRNITKHNIAMQQLLQQMQAQASYVDITSEYVDNTTRIEIFFNMTPNTKLP